MTSGDNSEKKAPVQMAGHFVTYLFHDCSIAVTPHTHNLNVLSLASVDDGWYRARIVAIDGDLFRVQYIDFGNYDLVSSEELLPLPQQFVDISALAFPCSLAGKSIIIGRPATFQLTVINISHCVKFFGMPVQYMSFSSPSIFFLFPFQCQGLIFNSH